tara:strand:+ start:1236 stop:1346 length:111 start_codon:yes stop_codon:yes gene_type:complete
MDQGQFPTALSLGGNCVAWRFTDLQKWANGLEEVKS